MADLEALLENPVDEIEDTEVPEGTFKFTSFMGKLTDEAEDKNGNPYRIAMIGLKVTGPVEDSVDPDEWARFVDADGPDEAAVFYRTFLSRRRDIKQLQRILDSAGVPTSGRTLHELMQELKDGYSFVGSVKHDAEYGPEVERLSGANDEIPA